MVINGINDLQDKPELNRKGHLVCFTFVSNVLGITWAPLTRNTEEVYFPRADAKTET